jgi:hypothetical protein
MESEDDDELGYMKHATNLGHELKQKETDMRKRDQMGGVVDDGKKETKGNNKVGLSWKMCDLSHLFYLWTGDCQRTIDKVSHADCCYQHPANLCTVLTFIEMHALCKSL